MAKKILYIDCPMGVSGDMFLGALIDLGVKWPAVLKELKKLGVGPIRVKTGKEARHSISATAFRVTVRDERHHRTFADIKRLIDRGRLQPDVRELSVSIFRAIAEAEGRIHGISPEKVHFHEVGALDSIIDIVGAAAAFRSLGVDEVVSSKVALGSGWTDTMHGRLPIPAPATLDILKGAPVVEGPAPFELTTPTGAAIVKTLASSFAPMPEMTVRKTGYGAGKKDFKGAANVLRVVLGEVEGPKAPAEGHEGARLWAIESNIDDMSPQIAGYLMDSLFKKGAVEVYYTPVQMKKSRPGFLVTALVDEARRDGLMDHIMDESTAIGVRAYPVMRRCLERKTVSVRTAYGPIRVKVSVRGTAVVNAQPEYEDCRAAAERSGTPLKKVIDAAKAAFGRGKGPRPRD